MIFHEDWYSDTCCEELAKLATKTDGVTGLVVEIGCWEGRSTIALANAVHPDKVFAVDTWQGTPGEISEDLARDRDVYATFLANIEEGTDGNVIPVRSDWRDYLPTVMPIRFCHIDAAHTYADVFRCIEKLLSCMADGGLICGDDAHHPPVVAAVLDALGDDVNVAGGKLWWLQL